MNRQTPTPSAQAVVSQRDFTACVDRCVALLLAPAATGNPIAEPAQAQLRGWLDAGASSLEDGTPIDFSLFDATILSVEDRVPVGGATTRTQLLRAARQLAESIYAGVMPRVAAET